MGSQHPPLSSVYTWRKFCRFHSSSFSDAEKGTDSFLVTHPPSSRSRCYHGKIRTFGILGGLPLSVALQPSMQTAAPPREACEIGVSEEFGVRRWD